MRVTFRRDCPITGLPVPLLYNSSISASVIKCPFQTAKSSMLNLFSTMLPNGSCLEPSVNVLLLVVSVDVITELDCKLRHDVLIQISP